MKKENFKNKDQKELKELLEEKGKKLHLFKQQVVAGQNKNVKEGRELRKDIARVLTALNNQKA